MATHDKNRRAPHPAVSISSWLFLAVAIELASLRQLLWLAIPVVFLLARREAVLRFVRLVWKARWLWLALVFVHAWTVPGTLLWPSDYSPSLEGLQAGMLRVGRLLLMLAALARLLAEFSPQQLAGGVYLLAKPLAGLGLDRRALAVRLALTLERMEQPAQASNWLHDLKSSPDSISGPDEIRFLIAEAELRDALVFGAAAILLGAVLI
jgi:hypothetical protein